MRILRMAANKTDYDSLYILTYLFELFVNIRIIRTIFVYRLSVRGYLIIVYQEIHNIKKWVC